MIDALNTDSESYDYAGDSTYEDALDDQEETFLQADAVKEEKDLAEALGICKKCL